MLICLNSVVSAFRPPTIAFKSLETQSAITPLIGW